MWIKESCIETREDVEGDQERCYLNNDHTASACQVGPTMDSLSLPRRTSRVSCAPPHARPSLSYQPQSQDPEYGPLKKSLEAKSRIHERRGAEPLSVASLTQGLLLTNTHANMADNQDNRPHRKSKEKKTRDPGCKCLTQTLRPIPTNRCTTQRGIPEPLPLQTRDGMRSRSQDPATSERSASMFLSSTDCLKRHRRSLSPSLDHQV